MMTEGFIEKNILPRDPVLKGRRRESIMHFQDIENAPKFSMVRAHVSWGLTGYQFAITSKKENPKI